MIKDGKHNNLDTDSKAVNMSVTQSGDNHYTIIATATFNSGPERIWELLWDWEQLLAVGLPGMTENFQWISGGPDEVPSQFQFELGGAVIKEEIYERTTQDLHCLRYRTLEPSLGVFDYDAILELSPIDEHRTAFSAIREVTFEAGIEPDMLVEMVRSETKHLQDYFAD